MRTSWDLAWTALRARLDELGRDPDAGYTTEAVLVTALLVAAAVTVVAIIVAKVISKAHGINLGQ